MNERPEHDFISTESLHLELTEPLKIQDLCADILTAPFIYLKNLFQFVLTHRYSV